VSWLRDLGRKLSGAEAREREAERQAEVRRRKEVAQQILQEHEARDHFDAQGVINRLSEEMPEEEAIRFFIAHCKSKVEPAIQAALADGLISPEEDARIERLRERYGGIQLDDETKRQLAAGKEQFAAWSAPLLPVNVPLMLKKDEWCAHAVRATVFEERQRTVRVNYGGPTASVRIVKGVYYRAGSIQTQRITESYHHTFGEGVLGATNKRLLWVSPQKSISIPLQKVVMTEPFIDGIKVIKDTGKPLLFVFDGPDQASMVRISRVIEELR
jgi:hypothetical protein